MAQIEKRLLVDAFCQEPHFVDHLAPVWLALRPDERGTFFVPPRLLEHAKKRGIEAAAWVRWTESENVMLLNASGALRDVERYKIQRPIVFFEHGAGFTFAGRHPSYAGSPYHRQTVKLFCNPNKYAQLANSRAFPKVRNLIIGTPKLDRFHMMPPKPREDPPVICISFHWDCMAAPETRGGWGWYCKALPALAARHKLIGHAHPRIFGRLAAEYKRMGIEPVQDFEEVMQRADLYVNDCSSTLYEFASLDRPVVVMNLPIYRRREKLGLRFWEHADVGVNCDRPDDLIKAIDEALLDPPAQRARRLAATEDVFPNHGHAAETAAEAIAQLAGRRI